MKILIINCHSDNRGDEAAIHSLVDELQLLYKDCEITLAIRGAGTNYPNMPKNVKMIHQFSLDSWKQKLAHDLSVISYGKITLSQDEKVLIGEIKSSDIILHAPGGPSIGDTYYNDEESYLKMFDLVNKLKKPYMFYAPSMGPFERIERNKWRKSILNNASAIVLRDPISAEYVRQLVPCKKIYQTLDSALQHDIDMDVNRDKLESYEELFRFLADNKKCVGVTITDLLWHPVHSKDPNITENIRNSFSDFLRKLTGSGYGIIFIPQLYGAGNDYDMMKKFMGDTEHFFIIPSNQERYDTYFQQYLISRLYAVVGMRYHSNIFSAKMSTPFISVSYEQKMEGFMKKMKLSRYCIRLRDLSNKRLILAFRELETNHEEYRIYLQNKHNEMKKESYKTTEILKHLIDG